MQLFERRNRNQYCLQPVGYFGFPIAWQTKSLLDAEQSTEGLLCEILGHLWIT
jgi:hypothetical protein